MRRTQLPRILVLVIKPRKQTRGIPAHLPHCAPGHARATARPAARPPTRLRAIIYSGPSCHAGRAASVFTGGAPAEGTRPKAIKIFAHRRQLHANYKLLCYTCGQGGMRMPKILIVEDDRDIQELLNNFLQGVGYETAIACDGVEAVTRFSSNAFALTSCCPKWTGSPSAK